MLFQDRVPYLSACPSPQICSLISFPAGWCHIIAVSPVGTASLPFAMLITLDNCLQAAAAVTSFNFHSSHEAFMKCTNLNTEELQSC